MRHSQRIRHAAWRAANIAATSHAASAKQRGWRRRRRHPHDAFPELAAGELAANLTGRVFRGVDVHVEQVLLERRQQCRRDIGRAGHAAGARAAERNDDVAGLPLGGLVNVRGCRRPGQFREGQLPLECRAAESGLEQAVGGRTVFCGAASESAARTRVQTAPAAITVTSFFMDSSSWAFPALVAVLQYLYSLKPRRRFAGRFGC